ncbi:MAG: dihydrofolate synthase, partial [Actinobacteria bacterium]|nr:dihydrofolate synthase [Actinomycetota bacterium]
MKYSQAVDYLESKVVLGVNPSLERIRAACDCLGNPQNDYSSVQITGTNGKTSVSLMTSSILSECGFRVGLYTSPHLETVRERVSVNGKLISVEEFSNLVAETIPVIEKVEDDLKDALTYFEVVTLIAFQYFKRMKVDLAVFEVGMGGRWDATNVVDCDVAVITNVDMDHTNELGDTLEAIAG